MSFLGVLLSLAAVHSSLADGIPIQKEVGRLESLVKRATISRTEVRRLAELYFMTSRCSDIKGLLDEPIADKELLRKELSLLSCACGESCGDTEPAYLKLKRFRALLEGGTPWRDPRVRELWASLRSMPEAKYWAVKVLRDRKYSADPSIQHVRVDLEKSLESLEVR